MTSLDSKIRPPYYACIAHSTVNLITPPYKLMSTSALFVQPHHVPSYIRISGRHRSTAKYVAAYIKRRVALQAEQLGLGCQRNMGEILGTFRPSYPVSPRCMQWC